ncbi:DUF6188 family protein [Saccharomonospora marina]|uniref:DUF6188 family protein n=1 Tax=Saccharomonospora marina TaxID=632569 RepID=UPI0002E03FAC|nr:DUF6188 family protein [Saccharomonospora marina]
MTTCDFDHLAVIRFSGGYEIGIENDFQVSNPAGQVELSPGVDPDRGRAVLATLQGRTVELAGTDESGGLLVSFGDGTSVHVSSDEEYESWTLAGPGGMKVVCMPGGELAVCSGDES